MSGSRKSRRSSGRSGAASRQGSTASYPRSARINETLREVLADELERLESLQDGLGLLTITAVRCDPDLRRALVLFSSLGEREEEALDQARARLQGAVAAQVRLKRTPLLRFAADPAVAAGMRVEDILRSLPAPREPADEPDRPDDTSPTPIPDAGAADTERGGAAR